MKEWPEQLSDRKPDQKPLQSPWGKFFPWAPSPLQRLQNGSRSRPGLTEPRLRSCWGLRQGRWSEVGELTLHPPPTTTDTQSSSMGRAAHPQELSVEEQQASQRGEGSGGGNGFLWSQRDTRCRAVVRGDLTQGCLGRVCSLQSLLRCHTSLWLPLEILLGKS